MSRCLCGVVGGLRDSDGRRLRWHTEVVGISGSELVASYLQPQRTESPKPS